MLTGLPDEPVILAVGFGIGGKVAEKNLTQLLDQFLKPEFIGESVSTRDPERAQERDHQDGGQCRAGRVQCVESAGWTGYGASSVSPR